MKLFISKSLCACALHVRKKFASCCLSWGLGLVLTLVLASPIFATDYSIGGCAYFTTNGNNWGVSGATIQLYDSTSDTLLATAKTAKNGQFTFSDLDEGTYYLTNSTANATWTSSISEITLTEDSSTVNYYNFSSDQYPIQLLSKRMLIASVASASVVKATVEEVPEPGTIIMLFSAIVGFGAWMARKRFCK